MSEIKIFSVDRIEGDIAVCISDDDDVINADAAILEGMKPRDIFSARIDGEGLVDVTPMPEERDRRLKENRARLHALAKRSKK